jgi:TPR repeat protein
VEWFQKAAAQRAPLAQFSLGVMYADGRGADKDLVKAHMWLNLAATAGQSKAGELLDVIAKDMSSAQIAQAQQLANAWRPGSL